MEKEIELYDLWEIIRRRLNLILTLTMASVLVSGIISVFVLKPEYEATATILVQSQNLENQNMYNDIMANQKLVKTYAEIIKSRQIAEDVIQHLQLDVTTEELLEKVRVEAANESLVTSITVTDQNPEKAALIANSFAESFYNNIHSIMKVDNVSILDEAKWESAPKPVRPKPLVNMAIALVLGLMVGVGLALLLEYLDKTIKTEEQVETLLEIPVLGVIADFEVKKKKEKRYRKIGLGPVGGPMHDRQTRAGKTDLPV